MDAYEIILAPVVTEKSVMELQGKKYTFKVNKKSNKIEIAKAITELFGKDDKNFKVLKVNTLNVRGKKRRQGRFEGYTPSWKKAVITLSQDSKGIEFFDGLF